MDEVSRSYRQTSSTSRLSCLRVTSLSLATLARLVSARKSPATRPRQSTRRTHPRDKWQNCGCHSRDVAIGGRSDQGTWWPHGESHSTSTTKCYRRHRSNRTILDRKSHDHQCYARALRIVFAPPRWSLWSVITRTLL